MPHPDGDTFLASQTCSTPIAEYKGAGIIVHANYYLQNILDQSGEPLLPALGGYPFRMKQTIVSDLENWKIHGIAPKFYFDGQATPLAQETQMRESTTASTKIEAAWKLYTDNRPQEAVTAFGKAGAVRAHDLTNFFQQVLFDLGIAFEVAPYSACAQMAYIDRQDTDWALGVYGPPELLVYNINDSIITKIDAEKGVVQGLVKSQLLTKLACTEETFIDAFLMTGTSSLPAFPPLRDAEVTTKQPYTILDAVNMYRAHGKSFITLCELWAEHLKKHDPTWQDKYQRARMAIKHAVVISLDGQVEVDHFDELTEDHHEYIGLHLAPELYHYQAKNVVSPRVLNWLSSLKMYVSPPLDGAESPEYRKLVADLMTPIQEQAVSLYASRLHRAFQHKAVEKYVWYDDAKTIKLNHRDVTPQPEKQAASWRVDGSTLKKVPTGLGKVGSFGFALKSLEDDTFRAETIKKTPAPEPAIIISAMGIKANAIWRFLHLRGYINDEHVLTEWGNALLTTIKAAPLAHQEEAAVLAFELLRLGVLNVDNPKWDWIGAPNMGSEEQNTLCLLISRVACLLPFRHQEIGYTGPLSRNLLAYHSVVNAVRECDRDLIETVVATMFLNAHAERRDRKDWDKLGYSLPFGQGESLALAIAVKHYLDEQHAGFGHLTEEQKGTEREKYESWPISYAVDSLRDIKLFFEFFEALAKGVALLGDKVDQELWRKAGEYLTERKFD